jgi:hypothetical protein
VIRPESLRHKSIFAESIGPRARVAVHSNAVFALSASEIRKIVINHDKPWKMDSLSRLTVVVSDEPEIDGGDRK